MHRRLALAIAVVTVAVLCAACGPTVPSTAPATATSTVGQYRLDLTIDKTTWRAGDLLTGSATLMNTGSAAVVAYGSGTGLLSFAFTEVGGSRQLFGVMTADCAPHDLPAGTPMTTKLSVNGGSSSGATDAWLAAADDPNGARRPAGMWDVGVRGTLSRATVAARPSTSSRPCA